MGVFDSEDTLLVSGPDESLFLVVLDHVLIIELVDVKWNREFGLPVSREALGVVIRVFENLLHGFRADGWGLVEPRWALDVDRVAVRLEFVRQADLDGSDLPLIV